VELIVHSNREASAAGMNPWDYGTVRCCAALKPQALLDATRAGAINDFAGISAPYEVPEAPQLRVQTDRLDPGAAVEILLEYAAGRCFEPD
jgi:adenylylsulfate kinase-like enzyme